MGKPLDKRSIAELDAAKRHLKKIEEQAIRDSEENPGAGWEPVRDLLNRDIADVEEELERRLTPPK